MEGDRPIIVCEFGFTKNESGGYDAAAWANDALHTMLEKPMWPRLRGFSWWNESWDGTEMRVQKIVELAPVFQAKLKNPNVIDHPLTR
ncbi:MAG: hypothetical protein WD063_06775 [Pirellulales bacterium]